MFPLLASLGDVSDYPRLTRLASSSSVVADTVKPWLAKENRLANISVCPSEHELSSGDESPICESDEDEIDATERSDHETGSELEVSDQEIELDNSSDYSSSNFYLGKDKVSSCNIIKLFPGRKGQACEVSTKIECLESFIHNTVIGILTVSTNIYIQKVQSNYQRYQDAHLTNEIEMSAPIEAREKMHTKSGITPKEAESRHAT
nr:unnamed protein product [Callosobruchus analis]